MSVAQQKLRDWIELYVPDKAVEAALLEPDASIPDGDFYHTLTEWS